MSSKVEKNLSENEDDPDVYESSGDEWAEEKSDKKRGNRRISQRLSKKPRVSHAESDEDEVSGGKGPAKSKNGVTAKKPKAEPVGGEDEEEEDEDEEEDEENEDDDDDSNDGSASNASSKTPRRTAPAGGKISGSDFVNGGFLILKKDAANASAAPTKPCLWRIDGKALLQKYEPFEEEGQSKHRNTSIYTGWSTMDKEMYLPVTVKVLQHQGQNMVVSLNWDKLNDSNNDSD